MTMTKLDQLGGTFVSPRSTLEYMSRHPDVLPWLAALAWLVIPAAMMNAIPGPGADPTTWVPVIDLVAGFGALILFFAVKGGALWLLGKAFGGKARFYPLLCVAAYTHFPLLLQGLVTNAIRVIDPGFELHIGLRALFPNLTMPSPISQLLVSTFLSHIEIFTLWSLSLTILGVWLVFRFRVWKATVVVLLWWIVWFALVIGTELLVNFRMVR
jgi:hypothetical protein